MVCLKQVPNLGNQESSQGILAEQQSRAGLRRTDIGTDEWFLRVSLPYG